MLQGQALQIVINMAKHQLEDCPNCGKSKWKEVQLDESRMAHATTIRDVWGAHYGEAIKEVESLLSQFEDTGNYTEDDYMED